MAISISNITADDRINDIECHFKIEAGPGAGKTRWLINHIRRVIRESNRLGNSRKIACITYTNTAVETILERLGTHVEKVEVSTIHGFLYKNLVKPFAFLIPAEFELSIEKMDGHDDIPVYKGMLYEWKKQTAQTYIKDDEKVIEALKALAWQFDSSGQIVLHPNKPYLGRITKTVSIKNNSYLVYKKMCWQKGLVAHEDVLFFSYILITQFPRTLDVLRAKFPYFYIDEFQDTNPIQTYILKKISEVETIVGVIGDVAQSIYGFQGAKPEQFIDFSLPGIKRYSICDNHRCTNKIKEILNFVRFDISQQAQRNIEGIAPKILVGNLIWGLDKASELVKGPVCSLSRDNLTSNIMRNHENKVASRVNLIDKLREHDSNISRANIIIACIKAVEFGRQLRYREAFNELTREFKKSKMEADINKTAVITLKSLLSQYKEFYTQNLLQFHARMLSIIPIKISAFRAGEAKNFYESNTFYETSLSVNLKEDTSFHRTIHKSKGAQFENVLLILNKSDKDGNFLETEELGFLLAPDLINEEEHRVRYVAISRARDTLFINIPSISAKNEGLLCCKGFEIIKEIGM